MKSSLSELAGISQEVSKIPAAFSLRFLHASVTAFWDEDAGIEKQNQTNAKSDEHFVIFH